MPDIEISERGIQKLLNNLNLYKAARPNQIRLDILKNIAKKFPIFWSDYSKVPISSLLPNVFEKANVAPVYTKGSR